MKFAIYSRDDSGMVTYVGVQSWPSLYCLLSHYFRDDAQPEHGALLGWPHTHVTWYRDIGIGSLTGAVT